MKRLFLVALVSFACKIVCAQITTTLAVIPQPPASLYSWGTKELTYIINNQPGSASGKAVIKATLKTLGGEVAAITNLAKARVINIGPGTTILYAADVIPLEAMIFNGKFKTSLDKNGKLPAGNYELCVQLVNPTDFLPITQEQCRNFNLASYQLPIPMTPSNEEVLEAEKAQTAITFRWTPVTPRPAVQLKYIVTVFEILDRQTPMQALRSNQPLLTKEIIGTTQFIWQPQLFFTNANILAVDTKSEKHYTKEEKAVMDSLSATRFIWTIQTLDSGGIPFGDGNVNGDGISEPNVFTVIRDGRKIKSGLPARTIYMNSMKGKRN